MGFVVNVDTVEGNVALVAVRAVDRATAAVEVFVDVTAITGVGDASLEREEIRHVSGLDRQLLDLVFAEGVAERSVRSIEGNRLG